MNEYVIMTDSAIDLPADMIREYGIEIVPLTYIIEDKIYADNPLNEAMTPHEFYDVMRDKKLPTTSAANPKQFEEKMEEVLKQGKDIICITISGATSCTYNSARLAGETLSELYPDNTVYVVDSFCASMGEGMLAYLCARKKAEGASMREVIRYAEAEKKHICHLFTVDDLYHVMRSGRATKTSALLGSILNVKPVLKLNDDGIMETIDKARGRKCAFKRMIEKMKIEITDVNTPVFIGHGDCLEEAEMLAELIRTEVGVTDITINAIGPICANQSGPGVMAVFYRGDCR